MLDLELSTSMYSLSRVEGRGEATITDVVYSSKTTAEDEKPASDSKERYESLKVLYAAFIFN